MEHDYGHDVRLARSPLTRLILLGTGHFFVAVAVAGIFLPVVPTTGPLLVAAACYARASHRFYNWLLNNKLFGTLIQDWRQHRAIRVRHKIAAIALVIITFGTTIAFAIEHAMARLALGALGIGIVVFLVRIPKRVKGE